MRLTIPRLGTELVNQNVASLYQKMNKAMVTKKVLSDEEGTEIYCFMASL